MGTKRQVDRAAEKLGASIDWDSDCDGCMADSAPGKVWVANWSHVLCVHWEEREWRAEELEDLLDRMAYGLADCDDPDCDICAE